MLKNRFLLYCFYAVLGIIAISCTKEPDLIGLDLLPAGDRLNIDFIDSSTVVAYTVREDSLRTDELSLNLLGSIADPVFGTTTASIYTQYSLSKNNITFGENAVADSMVLTLVYKGVYGDSISPKTIKVYELAETMNYDDAYYSTQTIPTLPELIGEATFVPNFKEADSIDGNYYPPHMRVLLSQAFMNKLISSDTLKDNESFQKVFKGLYITSDQAVTSGTGSILYLNLLDAVSRLKIYYHNSTDTSTIDFPISSSSARFNNYNHYNFEGADPSLLQQFNGDTLQGSQRLFVQAMSGAKIKLRFPYLKALAANKRIAVNEALLVFTVEDTSGTYNVPAQLALKEWTKKEDDSTHVITYVYSSIPDEDEGSSFLDGKSNSGKQYNFRITRYIQDRLLNPELPDEGLSIFAVGSSLTGNRVILKGSGAPEGKIRLLIYYTIVD